MKIITANQRDIVVGGIKCVCYSSEINLKFDFSTPELCEKKCCGENKAAIWSYGNSITLPCRHHSIQKEDAVLRPTPQAIKFYQMPGSSW